MLFFQANKNIHISYLELKLVNFKSLLHKEKITK